MSYAGFWARFAALWLDLLILSPLMAATLWGREHFRLFNAYYVVPGVAFGLFYGVYLVRQFGGTPGKRLMKLRIVKVTGEPVTYREALLRYLPDVTLGALSSSALAVAVFQLSDAQYFAAPSLSERTQLILSVAPAWHRHVDLALEIWFWSEFAVMLTNKRRRALHDFIAGTVVIRDSVVSTKRTSGAPIREPISKPAP